MLGTQSDRTMGEKVGRHINGTEDLRVPRTGWGRITDGEFQLHVVQ